MSRALQEPHVEGAVHQRAILLTCLAGLFATSFTATIFAVSLTRVADDLHSTSATVAWAITGPILAQAVALPIMGRLGDLHGHRKVYLVGFAVAAVFSMLTAVAQSALALIAFRTMAQLAGGSTIPSSIAMLQRAYTDERRVKAMSWVTFMLSGAAVSGLAVGGPIIDSFGWRPIFVVQAIACVVAFVPALVVLNPDAGHAQGRLDFVGAVLLATGTFALTFGVNRAALWGLDELIVQVSLAVAPVVLGAFVWHERRVRDPLLPLELFARRNVAAPSATLFFSSFAYMGSFVMTPLLLQRVFGYSASLTSLVTVSRTVSITASAPFVARTIRRFGLALTFAVATAVLAAASGLLAFAAPTQWVALVVITLMITGSANAHQQTASMTIVGEAAGAEHLGLGASLSQTTNSIGAVFGIGVLTALVGDSTRPSAFVTSYVVAAVVCVMGFLTALAVGRDKPRRRADAT